MLEAEMRSPISSELREALAKHVDKEKKVEKAPPDELTLSSRMKARELFGYLERSQEHGIPVHRSDNKGGKTVCYIDGLSISVGMSHGFTDHRSGTRSVISVSICKSDGEALHGRVFKHADARQAYGHEWSYSRDNDDIFTEEMAAQAIDAAMQGERERAEEILETLDEKTGNDALRYWRGNKDIARMMGGGRLLFKNSLHDERTDPEANLMVVILLCALERREEAAALMHKIEEKTPRESDGSCRGDNYCSALMCLAYLSLAGEGVLKGDPATMEETATEADAAQHVMDPALFDALVRSEGTVHVGGKIHEMRAKRIIGALKRMPKGSHGLYPRSREDLTECTATNMAVAAMLNAAKEETEGKGIISSMRIEEASYRHGMLGDTPEGEASRTRATALGAVALTSMGRPRWDADKFARGIKRNVATSKGGLYFSKAGAKGFLEKREYLTEDSAAVAMALCSAQDWPGARGLLEDMGKAVPRGPNGLYLRGTADGRESAAASAMVVVALCGLGREDEAGDLMDKICRALPSLESGLYGCGPGDTRERVYPNAVMALAHLALAGALPFKTLAELTAEAKASKAR